MFQHGQAISTSKSIALRSSRSVDALRRMLRLPLSGQRVLEVGDQILDVLQTDRQAHRVLRDPGLGQFLRRQLSMRGRGRMGGKRAYIAYVYQTREQLQRIQKARTALPSLPSGTLE